MKLLTNEKHESHENVEPSYIWRKKIENKNIKARKYYKVRNDCHYTGEYRSVVHGICNLKHSVPKKVPAALNNRSNYDYHFIKKE